ARSVAVAAVPEAPAQAVVTTVQPTCAVPSGTITVTAPIGAGLEYSINGVDYQASTIFSGLSANTYNVTVRNSSDTTCVSTATSATINAVPDAPAQAVVTTVQPTCAVPSGTITVTAPIGAGLEYSINGVDYQASTIFAGLSS